MGLLWKYALLILQTEMNHTGSWCFLNGAVDVTLEEMIAEKWKNLTWTSRLQIQSMMI